MLDALRAAGHDCRRDRMKTLIRWIETLIRWSGSRIPFRQTATTTHTSFPQISSGPRFCPTWRATALSLLERAQSRYLTLHALASPACRCASCVGRWGRGQQHGQIAQPASSACARAGDVWIRARSRGAASPAARDSLNLVLARFSNLLPATRCHGVACRIGHAGVYTCRVGC
jgi:hypothetical protein